ADTRILLAEDNIINQRIISALIQKTNLVMDIVSDGSEAVHAVRSNSYSLVLMDVQMPVMDGLTATRLIREEFQMKKLPIIAMTANAMKGDREKCMSAGMNDYLSKPINPNELFALFEHWILDHAL
ncbi:MAG: response regulator, partial [Bacteroidota bacterium]